MRRSHGRRIAATLAFMMAGCACLDCSSFGEGAAEVPEAGDSDAELEAASEAGFDASPMSVGDPIALSFGNCPVESACESDPSGLWDLTGGCVDEHVFDPACPANTLLVVDAGFAARGQFSAQGVSYAQEISSTYRAVLYLQAKCKAANDAGCAGYQGVFAQAGAQASCMDSSDGGCTCSVSKSMVDTAAGEYTRSTGIITLGSTGTTSARTFLYCATGDNVTTEETTPGAPQVSFGWARRR